MQTPALFHSILSRFKASPRQLFLVDALGASVTAFLTGVVLAHFEAYIGMPRNVLYPLAMVACVFAVYSFSCYFFSGKKWRPLLRGIAAANVLYCCVTLALAAAWYTSLTALGWCYFLGEMLVVGCLVWVEWRVSKAPLS